jgi:hypothetical protein
MIWITDKNEPQTSAIKTKMVLIYQDLYFTINLDITKNNSNIFIIDLFLIRSAPKNFYQYIYVLQYLI